MDATERAALVAAYTAGPGILRAAVDGVADARLDARPADGGWSAREIVHHTADSEMTAAIRLRRLVAEDEPLIDGYDGDEFARRLHYAARPIEPALAAIEAVRATTVQILAGLTDEEWARTGSHSELGPYGVERWLTVYAAHCHEHAAQIGRALAETG